MADDESERIREKKTGGDEGEEGTSLKVIMIL